MINFYKKRSQTRHFDGFGNSSVNWSRPLSNFVNLSSSSIALSEKNEDSVGNLRTNDFLLCKYQFPDARRYYLQRM